MPRWTTDAFSPFVLVSLVAPLAAQEEPPGAGAFRPGPKYCTNCHAKQANSPEKYWSGEHWAGWDADPHKRASEVLEQPLGKRMANVLAEHSSDRESWKGGVRNDLRCTSCHGGIIKPDTNQKGLSAGLSCFACHQQPAEAGKREMTNWVLRHAEQEEVPNSKLTTWRKLSNNEKKGRGFRPLHDPAERATMCLSCHIGNASEGKFVTHEMYAAGHPPLVGIELAKFSEDAYAEAHWLSPKDKRKADAGFANDSAEFRVQLAAHGSIDALKRQAELAEASTKPKPAFKHIVCGDYSFHDCASCHHDLSEKSWRRQRAESGPRATGSKVYGRPPLLEWPSTLAIALQGDSIRQPLDEFRFAATETPFGNPAKVAATAGALRTALATAVPKLSGPGDWRKLLRQVLEFGAKFDFDFDSARQIAWLAESLARSLGDADPLSKAVLDRFSKLAVSTEARYLPKWTSQSKGIPDLAAVDRLKGLADLMAAKRVYDPAVFRQWCRGVLAAAPPPGP